MPFGIRFVALMDTNTPFIPGSPDLPSRLRDSHGIRLAVFELTGHQGIRNYIAIPIPEQNEDVMIRSARALLHQMLSSLAQQSEQWKELSQEAGDTP